MYRVDNLTINVKKSSKMRTEKYLLEQQHTSQKGLCNQEIFQWMMKIKATDK